MPSHIKRYALFSAGLLVFALMPANVLGQVAVGNIQGTVTEQSGSVIPGVRVTATSPALQLPQVTTVTDAGGQYQLRDLPAPGVYRISFEFTGFQSLVRENLTLTVGFTARVDASLIIGEATTSITVTAEAPLVDTQETARSADISEQDLTELPRGGGFQEILPMSPGITVAGKPDVGDSNLGVKSGAETYGAPLGPTIRIEGMDLEEGDHSNATGFYISSYSLSDVEFKTTGQSADVMNPGFDMEAVVKSGGNSFHGTLMGDYENQAFQGNNITPALSAQGIKLTNPQKLYYDYSGDFGGRIIRDKLWFYVAVSNQYSKYGQLAFVAGPDANGCWTCGDAPPAYVTAQVPQYTGKLTYQVTKNLTTNFFYSTGRKSVSAFGASATTPFPSASDQTQQASTMREEVQWTPRPSILIEGLVGKVDSNSPTTAEPGMNVAGFPSSKEVSNNILTGPVSQGHGRPAYLLPIRGNILMTKGAHQIKIGTDLDPHAGRATTVVDEAHGDYQLLFNKGLPYEVSTYNSPVNPTNSYNSESVYAMDTWKIRRLTLNYGLRWDRYSIYYPAQSKEAGQLSAAMSYPGRSIAVFNNAEPRVGIAWDIFGKGKTIVKGSYGRFSDWIGSAYAGNFNPNTVLTTLYKWSGPCVVTKFNNVSYNQPNTSCDIAPATLASLTPSSPNYISASGGISQILNPNLKDPKYNNYTLRIEQQLKNNLAVSFGFVRYDVLYLSPYSGTDSTSGNVITPLRPYSAYSVAVPLTDPATGNTVNVYTYPSSYVGAAFNGFEYVSAPGEHPDHYTSFEVAINKRFSKRWNAEGSFWTTKNDAWIVAVRANPNVGTFPKDETRHWELRGTGMYTGPWGTQLAATFRGTSGTPGQRTVNFTSPLLLQGATTMPMEAFGAEQGPVITLLDLKVSKVFKLGEHRTLEFSWQEYNLLNGASAITTSYLTGSTFGRVTSIISPRIGRVGARFEF